MLERMDLLETHRALGALLAADGIPLHYGDQAREYRAALSSAVLMDRSHEGRLELAGRDRLDLMHRMSTNDLASLAPGQGRPTIFTTPNARILDRTTVYQRGETALVITEPGRGEAFRLYLQRNIFFNDDVRLNDLTPTTRQFALHGVTADAIAGAIDPELSALPPMHGQDVEIARNRVFAARNRAIAGSHWTLVAPAESAGEVFAAILEAGKPYGLVTAGSLTYNVLRIRAGRPGVGRELSQDYIPLELGLWDEVSFHKGCYTGQEIIARMESRGRLAKTIVSLKLRAPIETPAPIQHEGREIGTLTSSVTAPDGEFFAIGVVKLAVAQIGVEVSVGGTVAATIAGLPGVQPPESIEDRL
jgi:aminomethyltransferase